MTKRKTKTEIAKPNKHKPAEVAEPPADKKIPAKGKSAKKKLSFNPKLTLLVEMLSKKQGANVGAIVKATGWLPHTSRAMISGLRKAGHRVETTEGPDGKVVYRITGAKKKTTSKAAR